MNANPKSRERKQFVWPVAGFLLTIGIAATANPDVTHIAMGTGYAAWGAELVVVASLSANPIRARAAVLVAGLFLAVPCLVEGLQVPRFLLACLMGLVFARATQLLFVPPVAGFGTRLALMLSYFNPGQVQRRARRFDATALAQLIAATVVLGAAIATVKAVTPSGLWLEVRWFAGGIAVLSFAEMATAAHRFVTALPGRIVPPSFQSPWRAVSISEFWGRRWNLPASEAFHKLCFAPLARLGASKRCLSVLGRDGALRRSSSPSAASGDETENPDVRHTTFVPPALTRAGTSQRRLSQNSESSSSPHEERMGRGLRRGESPTKARLLSPALSSIGWRRGRKLRRSGLLRQSQRDVPTVGSRWSVSLALVNTFLASGIVHMLLALLVLGRWRPSLAWGAFFLVQPLPIAVERWLNVRRWRPAAGHAWTLAVLTITSPLFVEPMLQIIEEDWGAADVVLPPTLATLGFVILLCSIFAVVSLVFRPAKDDELSAVIQDTSG